MNVLKETTKSKSMTKGSGRRGRRAPEALHKCPCGSTIACKSSMNRHLKTRRHQKFLETGISAPKDVAEYQRRRYKTDPKRRESHKKICQAYYQKNKEEIYKRHRRNLLQGEGAPPKALPSKDETSDNERCSGCGRHDDFCRCGSGDSSVWWGE